MGGVRLTSMDQYVERLARELGKPVSDVQAALALREETSLPQKCKVFAEALGLSLAVSQKAGGRYEYARRRLCGNGDPKPATPPPIPAEFKEAMLLVATVEKLRTRRLALEQQIDDIKHEQEKIDVELKTYQPVLHTASLLTKTVQQMREVARGNGRPA